MKIDNCQGSNEKLQQLCFLLGTSDISKKLNELNESFFESFITKDSFAEIAADDSATYSVSVVKDKSRYTIQRLVIASMCGGEEPPHWEMPLQYLKEMISEELRERTQV